MNESAASLSTRIVELAHERRRFGYRRIHDLLSLEGRQVNHKRVWRLAQVDEIKGLALLLASPASSYMKGAVIPVDGGASAR